MGRIDTEEIIRALRCISSEPDKWSGCDGCPYYHCDQIDRDAAERLEELSDV